MNEELDTLEQRLANAKENLRLIQERKSEYPLSTDIPISLTKEERRLIAEIADLERKIAEPSPEPEGPELPPPPPPEIPSWREQDSPFPGLKPFSADMAPIFCGRNREVNELVAKLAGNPLVAVVGPSGVGKTSLVRAGLVPRLETQFKTIEFTPLWSGNDPFAALGVAFWSFTSDSISNSNPRSITELLRSSPKELDAYCRSVRGDRQNVLLFIDQFEDLFDPSIPEAQRDLFIQLLLGAQSAESFRVILTMRNDWYYHCSRYPELASLLHTGSYVLTSPNALSPMIKQPAEHVDLTITDDLAEEIVTTMRNQPGGLALMADTLHQLYMMAQERDNGSITIQDYRTLGGVERVISNRAEAAYAVLTTGHKEATLQRVFRALVDVESGADSPRFISRRALLSTFHTDAAARELIDKFVQARLLVMDSANLSAEDSRVVVVAHEHIFACWSRLSTWLNNQREHLYAQREAERLLEQFKQPDATMRRRLFVIENLATQGDNSIWALSEALVHCEVEGIGGEVYSDIITQFQKQAHAALEHLHHMLHDARGASRKAALRALNRLLHDDSAFVEPLPLNLPLLLDVLAEDEQEDVQKLALDVVQHRDVGDYIERLLAILGNANVDIQERLNTLLEQTVKPGHIPLLERIAQDEMASAYARAAAIDLLGRLESKQSAKLLIPMVGDSDPSVKIAAIRALGMLRAADAGPALRAAVAYDDEEVRQAVFDALKQLGDQDPLGSLLKANDPATIANTIRGMGQQDNNIQGKSRISTIIDHRYIGHPDTNVRTAVAKALGQIIDRQADQIEAPVIEQSMRSLITLLDDPYTPVRQTAAAALGAIKHADAFAKLEHVLLNDSKPVVRAAAASALYKLHLVEPGCNAADPLLKALDTENAHLKRTIVGALERTADPVTCDTLLDLLRQDPDTMVRSGAIKALRAIAIGDKLRRAEHGNVLNGLLETIRKDSEEQVQQEAFEALGELGDRFVVSELRKAFEATTPRPVAIRLAFVKAFGTLVQSSNDDEHETYLIEMAHTSVAVEVRLAAIQALCQMKSNKTLTLLRHELTTATEKEDRKTQIAVIDELQALGDQQAVPDLIRQLMQQDAPLSHRVLRALRDLVTNETLPYLAQALMHIETVSEEADTDTDALPDIAALLFAARREETRPQLRAVATEAAAALYPADPRTHDAIRADMNSADILLQRAALKSLSLIVEPADPSWIPDIARHLDADAPPEVQREAAIALGQIGNEQGIDALRLALDHERPPEVRRQAVHALGRIRSERARTLIESALHDQEPIVVQDALVMLKNLGDSSVIPKLKDMLQNENAQIRASTITALGQFKDRSLLEQFQDAFSNDPSDEVRASALEVLSKLGDTSIIPQTMEIIAADESTLEQQAYTALARLGSGNALAVIVNQFDDHQRQDIARRALLRIARKGDKEAKETVDYLANIVKRAHRSAKLLKDISKVILQVDHEAVLPAVERILKANVVNDEARRQMVIAIGEERYTPIIPQLLRILNTEQSKVRVNVVKTLGMLGDPEVVSDLCGKIQDPDRDVRQGIAKALGELKDERGLDCLIKLLRDDEDKNVQYTAAKALGQLGDPKAVVELQHMLDHSEPSAQENAIQALAALKRTEDVLPLLLDRFDRFDLSPQLAVLDALIQLGDTPHMPDTLTFLTRILKSDIPEIRQKAATALGTLGHAKALPVLIETLGDRNEQVITAVVQALQSLASDNALSHLNQTLSERVQEEERPATQRIIFEAALHEDDPEIRRAVLAALDNANLAADDMFALLATALQDTDTEMHTAAMQQIQHILITMQPNQHVLDDIDSILPLVHAHFEGSYTPEQHTTHIQLRAGFILAQAGESVFLLDVLGTLCAPEHIDTTAQMLSEFAQTPAMSMVLTQIVQNNEFDRFAHLLEMVGYVRLAPALLGMLYSDDTDTARCAETVLRQGHLQPIVGTMLLYLDPNQNNDQKLRKIIGQPSFQPKLGELVPLLRHDHAWVRQGVVHILGDAHYRDAVPVLVKLLNDTDETVRRRTVDVLEAMQDEHAVEPLVAYYQQVGRAYRFAPTLQRLLRLDEQRDTFRKTILLRALETIQKPDLATVRRVYMGEPIQTADVPFLLDALRNEGSANPNMHRIIERALQSIHDIDAVPWLLDALNDSDVTVQLIVIPILRDLQAREAVHPLLNLLKHPNGKIVRAASNALDVLGDENLVPGLIDFSNHSNPYVREHAARLLNRYIIPKSEPIIKAMLRLLDDMHYPARQHAIQALVSIQDERIIKTLMEEATTNDSQQYREAAVDSLCSFRADRVTTLLQEVSSKDISVYVRTRAISELANRGYHDNLMRLIEKTSTGGNESTRSKVIGKIASNIDLEPVAFLIVQAPLAHKTVQPVILRILSNVTGRFPVMSLFNVFRETATTSAEPGARAPDWLKVLEQWVSNASGEDIWDLLNDQTSPQIRAAALSRTSAVSHADVLPRLLELLQDTDIVRRGAVRELGRLQDARSVDAMVGLLQGPDMDLRELAAEALGAIGDTKAVDALLAAADDPRNTDTVRNAVLVGICNTDDPRGVPHMISLLTHTDPTWQMKALESVQRINQTHGTTALIQATGADQVEQRRAAIVAIERLAIYEAQEHLLRLMEEDTDESIRRDAAIALGKLADEVTGQKLLDRVSNPEAATDVRTKAIRALGFTTLHPDLDIVMPLSNIRNDPAQPVRLQVAYSLGQLEEKDGLETLRLLSNDENEDVRKAAEESIKLVEKALPVPPVEKLINDLKKPDVQARVRAAKKLGRVQTLDAVDALIETLGDANPMVQITAANALGKICHRKAEPALQRLSHSPNDTVRGAARNALARLESLKTESPPEALEDLPKPVSGDEQQVAVDTEAMVSATEPATQHDKVSHSAVSSVPSVPSSHAANAAPAPETPIQRVQAPAPSTTQPQMQPRPQTSQTPPEESGMPMWLVGGIVLVIAIVVVVVIVVASA